MLASAGPATPRSNAGPADGDREEIETKKSNNEDIREDMVTYRPQSGWYDEDPR